MKLPKHADLWLPAYLKQRAGTLLEQRPAKRVWVAITDHYEPLGGPAPYDVGVARVGAWEQRWPAIADAAPRDATGRPPCYTFFYPQEEYDRRILDLLAAMSRGETTDVEVHLHHDHDTAEGFAGKVREFCTRLREDHGLLHTHEGREVFGFIHGNWALDNSLPGGRWCGVQGELQVLRELGCYADFTMPSAPSASQSKIVNSIYWTTGAPAHPRGFDQGVKATVGGGRQGDLLMIQGPLGLRFRDRLLPRMEMGEVAANDLATPYRVERWLDLAPRMGEDIFIKLFSHGAREDNAAALLGTGSREGTLLPMFRWIKEAADRRGLEVYWASAFRMFEAVDARMNTKSGAA